MSALLVDAEVVSVLVHADSVLSARIALGTLMFHLGTALAVTEGRDPDAAGREAIEQVRLIIGASAAEVVAAAHDIETEQQREDAEQVERERAFEADVPWGSP